MLLGTYEVSRRGPQPLMLGHHMVAYIGTMSQHNRSDFHYSGSSKMRLFTLLGIDLTQVPAIMSSWNYVRMTD
jgi:hypothetical protein